MKSLLCAVTCLSIVATMFFMPNTASGQAQHQLCPTIIFDETSPEIELVELESEANGEPAFVSDPFDLGSDGEAIAEKLLGDGGDKGYVRTSTRLIRDEGKFVVTMNHAISSEDAAAITTSLGSAQLQVHVAGITASNAPAVISVDTFRTVVPDQQAVGWIQLGENEFTYIDNLPTTDHTQETIVLNPNEDLPLIDLTGFLMVVGEGTVSATTTVVYQVVGCGGPGGGPGELPIDAAPDFGFDDGCIFPIATGWSELASDDDCGNGGGDPGGGNSGTGGGSNSDVWNSVGPGIHVDVATGDVFTTIPVFRIPGEDPGNLNLELRYDSMRADRPSPLGRGWTHSYNRYVTIERAYSTYATGRLVLYDGAGRRHGVRFIDIFRWCYCTHTCCGDFDPPASCCGCMGDCTLRLYARPFGRTFDIIGGYVDSPGLLSTPIVAKFNDGELWTFANPTGGAISTIQDRRGGVMQFSYPNGRLGTITDKFGRTASFEYDSNNLLWKIHHPDEQVTTLEYYPLELDGAAGARLKSVTGPDGERTSWEYDALARMTKETLKNNTTWNCQYVYGMSPDNFASRTITDSNAIVMEHVETNVGFPSSLIEHRAPGEVRHHDGKGQITKYERDSWGRITKWITPENHVRTFDYGTKTNPNSGLTTFYPYLKSDTGCDIGTRHYKWNDNNDGRPLSNRLRSIKDAYQNETIFAYADSDKPALMTKRWSSSGAVKDIQYEPTGDVRSITDTPPPEASGELPLSRVFTYAWREGTGILESRISTDRDGRRMLEAYDEWGNLVERTVGYQSPEQSRTTFEYETADNRKMSRPTSASLHRGDQVIQTTFEYDCMWRLRKRHDDSGGPNPATTEYQYDPQGLLKAIIAPAGTRTQYEYDHRNRLYRIVEDKGEGHANYTTEIAYDLNDNISTVLDARGYFTSFSYNGENFLTSSVDAAGYETIYTRNAAGRAKVIDRARSLLNPGERDLRTIEYDLLQRPLSITLASGTDSATTSFDYANATSCACGTPGRALIRRITDPDNKVTYRYYDWLDRLRKIARKNGDTADNGGDSEPIGPNNPTNAPDAITRIEYYDEGAIKNITGPEGERIEFEYDGVGRRTTTRAIGNATTPNLVKTVEFDAAGNPKLIHQPNSNVVHLFYDGLNRLKLAYDSAGPIVADAVYDENSNLKAWKNGNGLYTSFDYDALGRLTRVFDPGATPIAAAGTPYTRFDYDEAGNRVLVIDKRGRKTQFDYDELNRPLQMVENALESPPSGDDTANTLTSVEYDGAGRTTALTDHDGNTTRFVYDARGRLNETIYPGDDAGPGASGTDRVKTEFSKAGDLKKRIDQRGGVTTYSYNDLHQLVGRSYQSSAGNRIENFEHDLTGRLARALNSVADVHFTYDALGRRKTESQNFLASPILTAGTTYEYVIDPAFSTRTIHYPGGTDIVETRDIRARLSGIDGSANAIHAAWLHDNIDRRESADFGFGSSTSAIHTVFNYDDLNRLKSVKHHPPGTPNAPLFFVEYGYDSVGNRTFTRDLARTNLSELYVHDPRDRLRQMQRGELNTAGDYINAAIGDNVHPWQQDWTLDARGNWSESNTIAAGQSDFKLETQPNGANELEEITRHWGQFINTTQPAYDAAGNLTRDPTAPNLSGIDGQQYEYDEENRLTRVRDSTGALLQEIAYDALGRRVESKDYTAAAQCGFGPPVVTRHLMAGLHTLEEHIQCSGSTWTLAREFIWGDRFPEPVAMVTHGGTSGGFGGASVPSGTSVYYYLHDVLGSVIGLANAAGQLVERYTYDPYGKTRVFTAAGTTPIQRSNYGNPFAWTAQRPDPATGLYHFLYRTFSPSLGRWLQRDPAGYVDGTNLYEYVSSGPVSRIDPLGLEDELDRQLKRGILGAGNSDKALNDLTGAVNQAFLDSTDGIHGAMTAVAHPIDTAHKIQDAAANEFYKIIEDDRASGNGDIGDGDLLSSWFMRHIFGGDELLNAWEGKGANGEIYTFNQRVHFGAGFFFNTVDLIMTVVAIEEIFCFGQGTEIATEQGNRPIEQIRPGDRVLATNDDSHLGSTELQDWTLVKVSLPNPDGPGRVEIEALRPAETTAQFLPGDLLPIDYAEFGVVGYARIESINSAPRIAPGCGRLVTATISRIALDVLRLGTQGCDKPIEISSGHRVFSIDRADWVPAASLTIGERIRTSSGASVVSEIAPVGRPVRVYNLEVDGDHCYFAGPVGLLSHNGAICSRIGGVYKVRTTEGKWYVGQTGRELWTRLKEHIRKGKITREAAESAEWIRVQGGRNARREVEQDLIEDLGGPRSPGCANKRNEIDRKKHPGSRSITIE